MIIAFQIILFISLLLGLVFAFADEKASTESRKVGAGVFFAALIATFLSFMYL